MTNYVADEGFVYRNKINGMTMKGMTLGVDDDINNYEIIPEPIEIEEIDEFIESNEDIDVENHSDQEYITSNEYTE